MAWHVPLKYIERHRAAVQNTDGTRRSTGQSAIIATKILEDTGKPFVIQPNESRIKIIASPANSIVEICPRLGQIIIKDNRQIRRYVIAVPLEKLLRKIACPVCKAGFDRRTYNRMD